MTIEISPTRKEIKLQELSQLRDFVSGQVITPDDPDYDAARQAWNLAVDQYPALIVIPQTADEVAAAVRFAGASDLSVAVQATGHGVIRGASHSLLIVTSKMTDVHVDPNARTAWVNAGAKWGLVLSQTQAVGLAPLLGSSPDVGAVGYTLGGGMGWLARKYGLSADSVNRFELVTTDGRIINTSKDENPDLFWGLRGGGGNFGVITGMEIRLYPVTTVYGGNLFYPAGKAKEVCAHYREWLASAPDELTSSIVLMNFPPIPEMPDFLRGQSFVIVRGCYCGPVKDGEKLLEHWRDWQAPLLDDFKTMSFSDVATISNDPVDPAPGLSSGAWLSDLSDETADILMHFVLPQGGPPLFVFGEVRHAGGAISKVDPHSAAYGNREGLYSLQVVGMTPTPEIHATVSQHVAQLKSELGPHLHGGVYLNFLEGKEARERSRQGYNPDTYARLRALKAKYDPQNRFSHSYDISPVTKAGERDI
ncbi:MAG: FAD-binding oxidoreductase [Anaerolineales bacterium]